MELVRPCAEYVQQYAEAVAEDRMFRPNAEQLFRDPGNAVISAYNCERGIGLKEGYVKATALWLVDDGRFIGEVGIRHELTPALMLYGGHIGYEIRYSECRKGYGTKLLAMALGFCKAELGLKRVLISCDDDNIGSYKIIERNGGIQENKVTNHIGRGTVITRRYWIEL